MAAAVDVVEFGFRDGVVDVDGGEEQFAAFRHLDQTMHACGRFFGNALDPGGNLAPAFRILFERFLEEIQNDTLFLGGGFAFEEGGILFRFYAPVNEKGGIAAVIDDLIRAGSVGPGDGFEGAVPVLFERFAFPCKHRHAGFDDGRRSLILRRKDVAGAPADIRTEFLQGFDQHSSLNGHVETAHDLDAFQRFLFPVFFPDRHQTGHLFFGNVQFFSSGFGKTDVADLVVAEYRFDFGSTFLLCGNRCFSSSFLRGSRYFSDSFLCGSRCFSGSFLCGHDSVSCVKFISRSDF